VRKLFLKNTIKIVDITVFLVKFMVKFLCFFVAVLLSTITAEIKTFLYDVLRLVLYISCAIFLSHSSLHILTYIFVYFNLACVYDI